MHEWSIAESITLALEETAKGLKGSRIKSFRVRVGELMSIDLELLKEALKVLLERSELLRRASFSVEVVETKLRCRECGLVWSLKESWRTLLKDVCGDEEECEPPTHYIPSLIYAYVRCPRCGGLEYEVVEGKSVAVNHVVYGVNDDDRPS